MKIKKENNNNKLSKVSALQCTETMIIDSNSGVIKRKSTSHVAALFSIFKGLKTVKTNADILPYKGTNIEKDCFRRALARGLKDTKYTSMSKLVSGGMGTIFQVLDIDLERQIAMKSVLPNLKREKSTLNNFITEAKITAALEHPNIVPLHDLGFLEEMGIYFTMKLVHGEALIDILNEIEFNNIEYMDKFNEFRLLTIFRKVCDAVSFAHSKNIIHRDIKPHNIMVGEYGEVLLMDWGLAKFIGDLDDIEGSNLTEEMMETLAEIPSERSGVVKGSPAFISPEQAKGEPSLLDKRSDIFLLGGTLYQMFTFEPPYLGEDILSVIEKASKRELIPPENRAANRMIPKEICRIIDKATALNKDDRYQTVDELAKDIDDLLAGRWSKNIKKTFEKGDFIIEEGSSGEEAYAILSGHVEVIQKHDDEEIVLAELIPGDIFGEMSLINKELRSATIRATQKTKVAILTSDIFANNLKKLPPYMEKIVSSITNRLRKANALVNTHLLGDPSQIIAKILYMIWTEKVIISKKNLCLLDTINEVATYMAVPPEVVKTFLYVLQDKNIISISENLILIDDLSLLKEYGELGEKK